VAAILPFVIPSEYRSSATVTTAREIVLPERTAERWVIARRLDFDGKQQRHDGRARKLFGRRFFERTIVRFVSHT
jgi:hypothetical protein